MRRARDIIVSAILLLILAPFLLVLAVLVRLTSPGPALFRQTRLGRGERLFEILKFRTMTTRSAEIDQVSERVLTAGDDTRVTPLGRILRATSIDELPQLWNILKGDMSIVGPRPLLPVQFAAIPASLRSRFNVRPGLTGLAQVRGRRSLDWLDQLEADCEYVANQSLWLDFKIIVLTVGVILKRDGVYSKTAKNWREYL